MNESRRCLATFQAGTYVRLTCCNTKSVTTFTWITIGLGRFEEKFSLVGKLLHEFVHEIEDEIRYLLTRLTKLIDISRFHKVAKDDDDNWELWLTSISDESTPKWLQTRSSS